MFLLLFEFQNMFATMYGCSSFDELLRSKVKNGKKGEEALRSYPFNGDIKNAPRGAWSSKNESVQRTRSRSSRKARVKT